MADSAGTVPEPSEQNPRQETAVNEVTGWRRAAMTLLGFVVRCWMRTLRVQCTREDAEVGTFHAEPVVVLLWHNRGLSIPVILRHFRNQRPVHALVSASRDGAMMGRFFQSLGMHLVRGSSSRMGREALHDMVECLRAGRDVGITPDGPRGPAYVMQGGGLLAARRARASILLTGVEYHDAWRLKTWDRYFVPKPFSRVTIRFERIAASDLEGGSEGLQKLERRLLELSNAEADVAVLARWAEERAARKAARAVRKQ